MATAPNPELISYVDSSKTDWREFRPGSRRKVLHPTSAIGISWEKTPWHAVQRAAWDALKSSRERLAVCRDDYL